MDVYFHLKTIYINIVHFINMETQHIFYKNIFNEIVNEDYADKIASEIIEKNIHKNEINIYIRNIYAWIKSNPDILKTNVSIKEMLDWDESTWRLGTNVDKLWRESRKKYFPIIEQEKIIQGKSILQCPKCKKYKVDFYTKQTRGADEPETIFARCTIKKCGHRWRK